MQFTSFSNPKDYIIESLNTANSTHEGAKNSQSTASNDVDNDNDPVNINDGHDEILNDKKSAGSVIINQYDPSNKKSENESAFSNEIFKKAVCEYMDYTDYNTNRVLASLNESEQNSLLLNLTNKLYRMIINKVDDIDYGEIPNTRGDITKLKRYDELRKCIKVLEGIFEQYREDTEPVKVIENAADNIENMRDLFMAGFMAKVEFAETIYNTMTLSVINSVSFMIAVCIEYVKSPKEEGLVTVLNRTGIAKVKDSLVYENLKKFNESCRKGDVENALRPLIKNKARGFIATAAMGVKAVLVLGGVMLALIPMIKDLVYFFFAARARVSTYFDMQAKLLEMNANELRDNPSIKTEDDKQRVIRKQLAIARTFHSIANAVAVDTKSSEVKADKEIKEDNRKYKVDEVDPTSDTAADGPLF